MCIDSFPKKDLCHSIIDCALTIFFQLDISDVNGELIDFRRRCAGSRRTVKPRGFSACLLSEEKFLVVEEEHLFHLWSQHQNLRSWTGSTTHHHHRPRPEGPE